MRSKNYAMHGQGQGLILVVFLICVGLLVWLAPVLDIPVEPVFKICNGR